MTKRWQEVRDGKLTPERRAQSAERVAATIASFDTDERVFHEVSRWWFMRVRRAQEGR